MSGIKANKYFRTILVDKHLLRESVTFIWDWTRPQKVLLKSPK